MKNHVLFSSKDKKKKLKCRLLQFQFLFGALRVDLFYKKKMVQSKKLRSSKLCSKTNPHAARLLTFRPYSSDCG